jgi:GR25 family glycosyltransferase involved in LPS biosynthesis
MKLFERFDKVFCINLDKREDRLKSFINEVNKYDLGDFERVSAIDGLYVDEPALGIEKGNLGLILTNIKILEISIQKNYNSILILEDDCKFEPEILNIESYFKQLPEDWDMLYMGGNHNTHMGISPPTKINDKVIKLRNTYSTHLVGIKSKMFTIIKDLISKKNKPIDVFYSELQNKFNVYSFYPAIAKQKEGFSDISLQNVNYDWLFK